MRSTSAEAHELGGGSLAFGGAGGVLQPVVHGILHALPGPEVHLAAHSHEFNRRARCEAVAIANPLRNGDLALTGDAHSFPMVAGLTSLDSAASAFVIQTPHP